MDEYELKFKTYNRSNKERSRNLRSNTTTAETIIRESLLKRKQTGYLFLRQKLMGSFILDFYCSKLLLCIEIDGSSHNDRESYDIQRDERLNDHGIEVIRFTNDSILNQLPNVYDLLQNIIKKREKTLWVFLPW